MRHHLFNFFISIAILALLLTGLDCRKDGPPIVPPDDDPDTTSQDFSISTWEFGDGLSTSYASDAWVFDRNNIWVVGLFQGIDSTNPQGYHDANIVRWDGVSWKPFNIFIATSSGFNSIFAVDTSLIFFSSGLLRKYEKGVIEPIYMPGVQLSPGQSIDYVWASDENNVWGVGEKGTIVHFDGSAWSKIPFDQNNSLHGIAGSKLTRIAYAVGWNSVAHNYFIIKMDGDSVQIICDSIPERYSIIDIQNLNEDKLILCGTSIYTYSLSSRTFEPIAYSSIFSFIFTRIAVAHENDVYVFGEQVGVSQTNKVFLDHYNGSRYTFSLIIDREVSRVNMGAAAGDNVAVFCMRSQQKALIISIRRNQS